MLAKGESLAILIRHANGDDWGYGDHVLKKLDGNYLVVAPDVTPNIGGVALLPGAYDVAIERSAATSRTESGFLVVSRAAYVSSWTAVTVAP